MSRFSRIETRTNCAVIVRDASQAGGVLLTFVVIVLTLFLLLGLAVDSGRLYTARLAHQAAADAGAIAGAALVARGKSPAEAIKGARDIASGNLAAMGIESKTYSAGFPAAKLTANVMSVTVRSEVPLYILRLLPGSDFRQVAAEAQARITPAAIAMILDTSDSMACPSTSADPADACKCAPSCPQGVGSGAKIEELKKAAKDFVGFFDDSRDTFSLIAFGHGAEVISKARLGGGFDLIGMRADIDGLTAQGGTNPSDGFIRAYLEMERVKRTGDAAYVFFSDGAPTAARFFFVNGRSTSYTHVNNNLNKPWSNYDYLSWGVVQRGFDNDGNEVFLPTPQRVHKTPPESPSADNYWNPRIFADMVPPAPPGWAVPNPFTRVPIAEPWRAFSDAVSDPLIYLPDGSTKQLGRQALWASGPYQWGNWLVPREHLMLYADVALVMGDFLRQQGGQLYGVGYGIPAQKFADPYQDAAVSNLRKDFFMGRMMNDPCGLIEKHPPFPGIPSLQEMATSLVSNGTYYPTANIKKLKGLFERIAVKIKLRMIS